MYQIESVSIGKVRNSVVLNHMVPNQPLHECHKVRIMQTTDRISAFDFVFSFLVDKKAEILQAISVWYFKQTKHIMENCFIGCLDKTHILVKEVQIFPVEFIVRNHLSGSLWRLYEEHGPASVFEHYGITLPRGMVQNQKFESPILTPSTKSETGHDMPLSSKEVCGILGEKNWNEVQKKAVELFKFGQEQAKSKGLILVDTKYEMGLYEGRVVLADEVHTPDSSRYWYDEDLDGFESSPRQLSKEFLREEIIAVLGKPEHMQGNPALHPFFQDKNKTKMLSKKISARYEELFHLFLPEGAYEPLFQKCKVSWPITQQVFREAVLWSTMPKNVLVVGNGGRDYTIYSCLANLSEVQTVYCASGARDWPGAKHKGCFESTPEKIAEFAKENHVGLVVVGPEYPIAQGIEQACVKLHIPILAPSLSCASLETSKIFCKEMMNVTGIKTAKSKIIAWSVLRPLLIQFLENDQSDFQIPCVLKYDGLAAGKGVFVLLKKEDVAEALTSVDQNLYEWNRILDSIATITYSKLHHEPCFLVEEVLFGEEISAIALCNGEDFRLLPIARDYKRRNNGQQGPNTGGMGALSPVCIQDSLLLQIKDVFSKISKELMNKGTPYYGFLFAGFMVDKKNEAKLLELNCRLGDPETQVLLPGLGRDFYMELFRTSKKEPFFWRDKSGTFFNHDGLKRIYVVGAAPEYPEKTPPRRTLVRRFEGSSPVVVIPSSIEPGGFTTGGRAFGILSTAKNFQDARKAAYDAMENMAFHDENHEVIKPHFRTDIGLEM